MPFFGGLQMLDIQLPKAQISGTGLGVGDVRMNKTDKPLLKGVKWRTDNPILCFQWLSLDAVWNKEQESRHTEASYLAIAITQTWTKAKSIYGIFMKSKTHRYKVMIISIIIFWRILHSIKTFKSWSNELFW